MTPTPSPETGQLAILAVLWIVWCALHSLLLQEGLRNRVQDVLGLRPAVYRLLYSIISILTLVPVVMYLPWLVPQVVLVALGLGIFFWASDSFSRAGVDLFGWRQARQAKEPAPHLVERGAYARLRHPMHLAGVILLWARGLGQADLLTSLLLTAYLALGTWHEERRLRRQFGRAYQDYAARVPIIPGLPW